MHVRHPSDLETEFGGSGMDGRCHRQIIAVIAFLDFAVALASLTHRGGLPLSAKESHRHLGLVSRFWEPRLQEAFLLGGDHWGEAGTEWLRQVLQHSNRVEFDENEEFGFVYLAGVSAKHRSCYVGIVAQFDKKHNIVVVSSNDGSITKFAKLGLYMVLRRDTKHVATEPLCMPTICCRFSVARKCRRG